LMASIRIDLLSRQRPMAHDARRYNGAKPAQDCHDDGVAHISPQRILSPGASGCLTTW
jgi:hypothetical protein